MKILKKSRTLRPSSRLPDSPYRVKLENTDNFDILELTIIDEKNPISYLAVFEFQSEELRGRNSIHFRAEQKEDKWKLSFHDVNLKSITIG